METVELEELVYAGLINNQTLIGLLANADKSIFHYTAPEVFPDLPFVVYSPILDVPLSQGDNLEYLHKVIMRIHIVHGKYDYSQIYYEVKNLMQELGFTRDNTTPYKSHDGVEMIITDYEIIIGG